MHLTRALPTSKQKACDCAGFLFVWAVQAQMTRYLVWCGIIGISSGVASRMLLASPMLVQLYIVTRQELPST